MGGRTAEETQRRDLLVLSAGPCSPSPGDRFQEKMQQLSDSGAQRYFGHTACARDNVSYGAACNGKRRACVIGVLKNTLVATLVAGFVTA